MSTISQDVCWSFVYRRIPLQCSRSITCTYCRRFIIFVHRVPLQYFAGDFEITALIEFWKNSLGGCRLLGPSRLPLTIFFYQPRSWERHCWNALGVVPACIFDVNVVWFDLFTESVENWKYRASLLTCIECSAVLHILYHQLTKHKSQYGLSLFDSRPLLFPEKINVCFVPSLKICLLSNTIVCLLLVIALVKYSKGHHLLALNWR